MTYELGVDLGTTYTAAAVRRGGSVRVVQLTGDSQSMPSVVAVRDDGELIAGQAAERRATTHPSRAVREFKRRFGDAAPIVLGGRAHSVQDLTARLLTEVIDRTAEIEGGRPARLALAHPASWGPFRLDGLRAAAASVGYDDVVLVPEPVAAALANRDRLPTDGLVVVYDLGGGTFDAAVIRNSAVVEILGTPEGVERLGGSDFDQAVLAHVDATLGGTVSTADHRDPDHAAALSRLRDECRAAKEALSADTEADVPVALEAVRTNVRLTRAEFESMIRPRLADSLAVLDRVVASTGAQWSEVDGVLLVGGSSRIPVVGQLVAEHTGRPLITSGNPSFSIAIGTVAAIPVADGTDGVTAAGGSGPLTPDPGTATDPEPTRPDRPTRGGAGRIAVAAGLLVAAAVAAVVVLGGGSDTTDDNTGADTTPTPQTSTSDTGGPDTGTTPGTGAQADDGAGGGVLPAVTVGDRRLDPVRCTGAGDALAGATDLAVSDGSVFVLSGGVARALTATVSDDGCRLEFDEERTARLAFDDAFTDISATPSGLVVGAGLDRGAVAEADGGFEPCAALRDRVVANGTTGSAVTWQADVGARIVRIGDGGCSEPADLPIRLRVLDVVADGEQEYLVGAVVDGTVKIGRFDSSRADWTQGGTASADDGYRSVDGLGRCGASVCILDAERGLVHLLATGGEHRGNVPADDLTGSPEVLRLVTASDGAMWLLTRDGLEIGVVRVAIS